MVPDMITRLVLLQVQLCCDTQHQTLNWVPTYNFAFAFTYFIFSRTKSINKTWAKFGKPLKVRCEIL